MVCALRPYSTYKDSGVLWLGQVPEHWQTRRIKHVAALDPSKSEVASVLSADDLVTFLPMQRVSSSGLVDSQESRRVSDVWNGFTYFRRSDVLVAKITPCFENGKGACLDSLPTEIGFGSTEFIVLRSSRAVLPRYLYRLTTVSAFRHLGADAMMGAAGQQRVPTAFVSNFETPVPPLPEQAAIVRYLDYMDRRIRKCIRAKQQLIALLNEQKQAIIQRAVTRGLDPNVRLKPSGVPWLGDIPEHWGVLRLKYACHRIVGGSTPKSDKTEYWDGDVVWVTPVDVAHSPCLETSLRRITREGLNSCAATLVPAGSIIITCRAPVGKVSVAATELCTNQGCKAIVLRPAVLTTAFGALLLRTLEPELQSLANGTTFSEISLHSLSCVLIPVPTTDEQSAIVQYVESATASLDEAIRAAHREIDLLREYRTRLIADVVTGKLDVRDAAANLPDESEMPPEPCDEEPAEDTPDLASEESDGEPSEDESRDA